MKTHITVYRPEQPDGETVDATDFAETDGEYVFTKAGAEVLRIPAGDVNYITHVDA